jgi:lysozyme
MIPNVVDLYHGDTVLSFRVAQAKGLLGVIHKASQGIGIIDPAYALRRQMARDAGLLWGAYHFATADDPISQVNHFLDCALPDQNTLVALDYEPNGASTMSIDQARAFLSTVETKLGRKAVLYSGNLIKETLPGTDAFFGGHRLWLAEYGPQARLPAAWNKYWLWQYSDSGQVSGISGAVDCDFYPGTTSELAAEWAS